MTLRRNQRQGVTPCESSAEAAKGDLCIRSDSPSWLAVQAPAEAAKGDLCFRSSSPSWLAVRTFLLFLTKGHMTRYSSRSRLSNGSLDGGCRNLQKYRVLFRDPSGSRTSSSQKLRVCVCWRVEKKRVLCLVVKGTGVSDCFPKIVHFAIRVFVALPLSDR